MDSLFAYAQENSGATSGSSGIKSPIAVPSSTSISA
jgi:hypothetical protein